MEIDIANIISGFGVIITAWLSYNQYTRNKLTDLKIEQYKEKQQADSFRRNERSSIVFGELWRVLYETHADRVYIMQPHPLGHVAFLSVAFEVRRKGVASVVGNIQGVPMAEIPSFAQQLAQNLYCWITDIDDQIRDPVAKSLLATGGCANVAVKRLNCRGDWVGSILCEFADPPAIQPDQLREVLHEAAYNIQYILPEYRQPKRNNP